MFCKGIKLSRILKVNGLWACDDLRTAVPSKAAQQPLKYSSLVVRFTPRGIERVPARSRRRPRCV